MISRLRTFQVTPTQMLIRWIIDKHFGSGRQGANLDSPIPLFICPEHIQKARQEIMKIKRQDFFAQELCTLLTIAPDTSSEITRPPAGLLAEGVAGALARNQSLVVVILPSYTDQKASINLMHALAAVFPGRIFLIPAEPEYSLLELGAFIDQSDIFISGDTGVMHLAATKK